MWSLLLISLFMATSYAFFRAFFQAEIQFNITRVVAVIDTLRVRCYASIVTIKTALFRYTQGVRMAMTVVARQLAMSIPTPLWTQLQHVWHVTNGMAIGVVFTLLQLISVVIHVNRLLSVIEPFVDDGLYSAIKFCLGRERLLTGNNLMRTLRFSQHAAVTVIATTRLMLAVKVLKVVVSVAAAMLPYAWWVMGIVTYGYCIPSVVDT
ncbi:hypothetical protein BKA63DRAFT_526840 [Paraphoma chrysanthemicola]|nr:hypothetical protein BKA63DRAFT_526840 [Paraphoma chrysanthemicola]